MPTVEIEHIRKYFGASRAVEDVSFSVEPGEVFGLLGPNGAGKTTTIRIMLDIFHADAGNVTILGGKLDEEKKNRIGYMPEERGLYKDEKLAPTIVYLATLKGMPAEDARQQLDGWLKRFDLYDHREKKISELSKGMQQKAQIIATFLHDPDLVVIDEPFSGLDPVNTRLIKELIEEQRAAGKTIIMSTHQMYQVEALCNRILLINEGEGVLYGSLDDIRHNFAGNAVVIEGQGDFEHLPGVLQMRRHNGEMHFALDAGTSPQDIFRQLAQRDGVKIERFEIAEPSLDDIFISVVRGEKGEEHV